MSSSREAARLQALARYDVLDTPPEAAFDRLTRLAARLFGVPIALVSFVEEKRQWFKSCFGIDLTETSREASFCTHALHRPEGLVVEDAAQDPRFAENPLVTGGLGIRFYAGAPIRTPDGFALGTLCLIDRAPRAFSAEERAALVDLADLAADELELRRETAARGRANAALRESERRYRSVVESTSDVVFQTDAEGRWTLLNPAWTEATGFALEESLGRRFMDFLHPDERRPERLDFEGHAEAGHFINGEVRYLARSGEALWMRVRARLLRDAESGAVVGTSGTLSDVTDSVRFRAEREARERAEELLRLKTALLNNMSHELRTPLTAILGFAGVLAEEVGEAQREFAERIAQSGKRLQATLNSVLDLAEIESGQVRLRPEATDVAAEARAVVELLGPLARQKGLGLRVVLGGEAAGGEAAGLAHACVDRACLGRVLNNLVGNAIKFTDEGAVTVELGGGAGRLRLCVRDTGIGISEAFLPHLFDEFRQESSGLTRSHAGNGLGLAITKRLVELMGGAIEVESRQGHGSAFTVTLPRRAQPQHEAAADGAAEPAA